MSDIEIGNKLIAVFMGAKLKQHPLYKDEHYYFKKPPTEDSSEWWNDFAMKYHSSWDWLMPAVKKWNDLVISKRTSGKAGWTKWQYKTVMLRTEIEPVFKDLVEAIKWYNTTIKKNTVTNE